MDLIYNPVFLEHETGMHPENSKRLTGFADLPVTETEDGSSYLELAHDPDYIEKIRQTCLAGAYAGPETPVSAGSFKAAVHAVGATIQAARRGDFALVRPPGHHAHSDRALGFCLFNNIAIAVEYLIRSNNKRVLILDFDGHLGDGSSKIFYDRKDVMYWSLHQYPAFPGNGYIDEVGTGEGKGYTVNVPLPPGSADDIFLDAFNTFLPVAIQFEPDIVAISAGFDAHQYDLLLDLRLSMNSFYETGVLIREHFDVHFATLEGGYNVQILPDCVDHFLAGINGLKNPAKEKMTDSEYNVMKEYEFRESALLVELGKYWKL